MDNELNVKPDSYALFQLRALQFVGLWPLDTKNRFKLFCYYVYSFTFLIIIAILSVSQIVQICFVPNIEEMSSTIDTATLNISGLYKMLYLIIYHDHFKSLVRTIDTYFVEQSIWDSKFKMVNYLRNTKLYSQIYLASALCVMLFWFLAPIIEMNFIQENNFANNGLDLKKINQVKYNHTTGIMADCKTFNENGTTLGNIYTNCIGNVNERNQDDITKNRKFPLNCWYPFDTKWTPLYQVIYMIEISGFTFVSFAYLVQDSFFFMIVYLVCGQFEIIKVSLLSIRKLEKQFRQELVYFEINTNIHAKSYKHIPSLLPEQNVPEYLQLEKNMYSALTFCIKHHQMLLEFLQDLEILYRPLILADVLHAILSLSFAMLQTTISVHIVEYVKFITFVAVCILHQFLNNYFSEILIQQQSSISESVYDTPWEDRSQAFKHTAMLMMTQSRTPVLLNGWKMYFLCLDTFKQFMSTLISYFMVLRQLQSDNRKLPAIQ